MSNALTAGALFAGIGGFCYGFERAGFETRWAVDNDSAAAHTYRYNFPSTRLIEKDVRDVSVRCHDLEPVDVLHAGFPCQSFSQAGARSGFEDSRGRLFFEISRIVQEFKDKKPSVLVFENSPYLRYGQGGAWLLRIQQEIKKLGYWFRESNCLDLDPYEMTELPQQRPRLFMVAFSTRSFRNGRITVPFKIQESKKRIDKFVGFDNRVEDYYYLSAENRYYKMITSQIKDDRCIYQLRKYLVRPKPPGVCPTLTANMGQGGHNVPFIWGLGGLRKLTEHECAALQGFPEEFEFPKDLIMSKRYTQVGNAVAVPVAQKVANAVSEKLEKERQDG